MNALLAVKSSARLLDSFARMKIKELRESAPVTSTGEVQLKKAEKHRERKLIFHFTVADIVVQNCNRGVLCYMSTLVLLADNP